MCSYIISVLSFGIRRILFRTHYTLTDRRVCRVSDDLVNYFDNNNVSNALVGNLAHRVSFHLVEMRAKLRVLNDEPGFPLKIQIILLVNHARRRLRQRKTVKFSA